jgi:Zn-dependent protease
MIAASVGARIKCALVLIIFMLIPILPVTGTIGLFIVIFRPIWFKKLVDNVYADKNDRLLL